MSLRVFFLQGELHLPEEKVNKYFLLQQFFLGKFSSALKERVTNQYFALFVSHFYVLISNITQNAAQICSFPDN